jgi:hypothetical protein
MSEFERLPEKKKLSQYIFGSARSFMIALVLFATIVVTTTDIRLLNLANIASLGINFFIFLFASYGMYICCADGGINAGYATDGYKNSVARFNELKDKIEGSMLTRMNEFCNYYCDEELRKMRMQYLAVVCIPYDVYLAKYVTLGTQEVNACKELKSREKKAINKANSVKRIKLTSEKIMTLGKAPHSRSVLGVTPDAMKNLVFGKKMVRMILISLFISVIAFDVIEQPTWTVFASCCLKLAMVCFHGYDGHREGFLNITAHTVSYINTQSLLMSQAIQYIEKHPTTQE